MAVPATVYDPTEGSRWLQSLTPAAQLDRAGVDGRRPRVHNLSGMTPALAAHAYARILNRRGLDSFARDQVPVLTPVNGPNTTPQVPTTPQKPPEQDKPPAPTQAAPPGAVPKPPPAPALPSGGAGDDDIRHRVDPPAVAPPSAPAGSVPIVTKPPVQPGVTIPTPPADPLLAGNGPSTDPLPMPSTEGREVGKPWTDQVGTNTVEFTIPEGNGLGTVDAVVRDAQGKELSRARIVAVDGATRYVRWQDYTGGGASYYESGGPNILGYGQHFAPGTSTAGVPDRIFETSADLTMTRTISLDSNGEMVGVDVGVRNRLGLYDNAHVDNFGNAVLSSTRFDPDGRLVSKFTIQQFTDHTGWMIDANNDQWEGTQDKDGNQAWVRVKDGHTYRMDHLGVVTDFSYGKDGFGLNTIFPDGSWTMQSGYTTIGFDAAGKEMWRKDRTPKQSLVAHAWNATKNFGSLIADTAGTPFRMFQDGLWGMSSIRVDPSGTFHTTYQPPDRIAEAGRTLVALGEGVLNFYTAAPKYAVMKGYDTLRGSDFFRGSTDYRPPDREAQLVKDLTGIPLEQWKDDTAGTAVEFGVMTVESMLLFRAAGIKPRSGGAKPTGSNPTTPVYSPAASVRFGQLTIRALDYGRSGYTRFREWGTGKLSQTLEIIDEGIAAATRLFPTGNQPRYSFAGGHDGNWHARSSNRNSIVSNNGAQASYTSSGGSPGSGSPISAPSHIPTTTTKNISSSPPSGPAAAKDIHLPSIAQQHILHGDGGKQGGHFSGTGFSGKTEFPLAWDEAKILAAAYETTQSGTATKGPYTTKDATGQKRWAYNYELIVDKVEVRVIVFADNGEIRTAFPLNKADPGVITNPKAPNPAPKGVPQASPPRYSNPSIGGDGSWTWRGPKGNKIVEVVMDSNNGVATRVLGEYRKKN